MLPLIFLLLIMIIMFGRYHQDTKIEMNNNIINEIIKSIWEVDEMNCGKIFWVSFFVLYVCMDVD